jgi:hypothetical protein
MSGDKLDKVIAELIDCGIFRALTNCLELETEKIDIFKIAKEGFNYLWQKIKTELDSPLLIPRMTTASGMSPYSKLKPCLHR